MEVLRAENIGVCFDGKQILQGVGVTVQKGETVSLLGVSGCGKTTLFNCLAGLLVPDTGAVFADGREVTGKPGFLSYMLQKDLLLEHKTVLDNAALSLYIRGKSKKESRAAADALFVPFGLDGMQKKYPHELSGGMRQRAALLRTVLAGDGTVLLDEPFSALDSLTKADMHTWLLGMIGKFRLSVFFITHDIDEAMLLSDRILILAGTPSHITAEISLPQTQDKASRDLTQPAFSALKKELLAKLHE